MTQMPPPRAILTYTHFAKNEVEKKAITLIIFADFTLNRTWPIFYVYIPVYKIWIRYTIFLKNNIEKKTFFEGEKGL